MRSVTLETLGPAFLETFADTTAPRARELITSLVRHLHAFARETNLSHAEWRAGLSLLMAAGEISDHERNEFVLFSDVLGLSSLVDMMHSPLGATSSSVLGPFHVLGAPQLPYGGDLQGDLNGETVVVTGVVRSAGGAALADAAIEVWQTAPNGLYSNQDPSMESMALRASIHTREDGRFLYSTVRPAPYTVPTDGPVGVLLDAMGRHPWRPAHFHFIVRSPGFRSLVTEIFPSDDPYLDEDAVFGVRSDLIGQLKPVTELPAHLADLAVAERLPASFRLLEFDITLSAEASGA
jgi:hydroxyquinol 1,2-dioxygenase